MTTETRAESAEDVIRLWKLAAIAGDADAVAQFSEEDAVLFIPTFGVHAFGRGAIREALTGRFALFEMQGLEVPANPVIVNGEYAMVHRTFRLTMRERESGEVGTFETPATEVFHRGADGGWRYHIDHAQAGRDAVMRGRRDDGRMDG